MNKLAIIVLFIFTLSRFDSAFAAISGDMEGLTQISGAPKQAMPAKTPIPYRGGMAAQASSLNNSVTDYSYAPIPEVETNTRESGNTFIDPFTYVKRLLGK